jgi:hypothetical protein
LIQQLAADLLVEAAVGVLFHHPHAHGAVALGQEPVGQHAGQLLAQALALVGFEDVDAEELGLEGGAGVGVAAAAAVADDVAAAEGDEALGGGAERGEGLLPEADLLFEGAGFQVGVIQNAGVGAAPGLVVDLGDLGGVGGLGFADGQQGAHGLIKAGRRKGSKAVLRGVVRYLEQRLSVFG